LSHLNPKAEELVRAGRAALRPTDADRERVFQALQPRLGGNVEPQGIEPLSTAPAKASLTIGKLTAALVAMSVAGAAVYALLQSKVPPVNPAAQGAVTLEAIPQAVDPRPETTPPSAPHGPSADEKRAPAAPRSADSLAKEIAMLSQASADLHAGRPAAALTVLDEHQRKFPHGELVQERTSGRIQALCALGRMTEAQAELARLARTSPNSPHLARARKACGSGATQKE
jgi:predicted Zn-dependent protease